MLFDAHGSFKSDLSLRAAIPECKTHTKKRGYSLAGRIQLIWNAMCVCAERTKDKSQRKVGVQCKITLAQDAAQDTHEYRNC